MRITVHRLLQSAAHRPYPLPGGPWIMRQTWHDLLFAHWPVAPEHLRPLMPAALPLDTFAGQAWVGVVPFRMSGIRLRGLPPLPGVSQFPELNVRTYVQVGGKPGVYFFSLDAANLLAVWGARIGFALPYFHAAMQCAEEEGRIHYASRRYGTSNAEFFGHYRPATPPVLAQPGSLEHWLTERYCLYTTRGSRVFRGEIHHEPWPLQAAESEIATNTMAAAAGITLPDSPPLLHFARQLDVLIWPIRAV